MWADVAGDLAEILHPVTTLVAGLLLGAHHGDARHGEQEESAD